jgi:ABC-2 type transport system permease protein
VTVLAIAGTSLRRTVRDRTSGFFMVLFPLLMILVIGLAFGGASEPRVAVSLADETPLAKDIASRLEASDGIRVDRVTDRRTAVSDVERGRVEAAVAIPRVTEQDVAARRRVEVEYLSRSDRSAQQVAMIVMAAVDEQSSRLQVARILQSELGGDLSTNLGRTDATAASTPLVTVVTRTTGEAAIPSDLGRFDTGASSQLLLFVFITSMTTATALIETRRLGVARRMFASPTRVSTIVAGEALGRLGVAVTQGLVIMVGARVFFGVSWGQPLAAALLMLLFAAVAAGAGMLLGATARNSNQAIATGLLIGLGLSALGGSMMPLEFFSPTLLRVAHLTPHAWAADGFASLLRHQGTVRTILPQAGVLTGYAAVLFLLGSWSLRRRMLHA